MKRQAPVPLMATVEARSGARLNALPRARPELDEALEWVRQLDEGLSPTGDGVLAFDTAYRAVHWSSGMERLWGRRARAVLGLRLVEAFPFLRDEGEDRCLDEALQGRSAASRERAFAVPEEGRSGYYRAWYRPLRARDGSVVGGWAIVRDRTGSRADLSARRTLEAELRKAVQVRDEFLSIASHELRTPLTALQLQLEGLLRLLDPRAAGGTAQGRVEKNANLALAQGRRLAQLVDSLLDMSRLAVGRLRLERAPVDLGALAREVAARFRTALDEKGSRLTQRLEAGVVGEWDPLRLDQVIANLLANAIKYGEGRPVELSLEADERAATLRVRDQGIGIALENHARIFERFERAVAAKNYGGFGLGLWIARQLVEAHGGSIAVESRPGAGATFRVVLPRAPALPVD